MTVKKLGGGGGSITSLVVTPHAVFRVPRGWGTKMLADPIQEERVEDLVTSG